MLQVENGDLDAEKQTHSSLERLYCCKVMDGFGSDQGTDADADADAGVSSDEAIHQKQQLEWPDNVCAVMDYGSKFRSPLIVFFV